VIFISMVHDGVDLVGGKQQPASARSATGAQWSFSWSMWSIIWCFDCFRFVTPAVRMQMPQRWVRLLRGDVFIPHSAD